MMNCKSKAVLTMFVVFSAMAVTLVASDDSSAADPYIVEGYIGTVGESGLIPHEATVTIYSADGMKKWSATTNEKTGKFSITTELSSTDVVDELRFDCISDTNGYTVFGMQPWMKNGADGLIYLDMSSVPHTGKTYTVCSDIVHSIVMSNTLMNVTIIVSGSKDTLRNAEVALLQNNEKKFSGKSDDEGNCKFTDVVIGSYELEITCNGYKDYDESIVVSKETTQFNVEMNEKKVETYYGLTTYHILMIVGVVIGLMLVAVSYALCFRSWKHVDSDDLQS